MPNDRTFALPFDIIKFSGMSTERITGTQNWKQEETLQIVQFPHFLDTGTHTLIKTKDFLRYL